MDKPIGNTCYRRSPIQHTRLDSRQSENALLSTIAYSSSN